MVSHMEDAVDTRGHQFLLGVSKVAHYVLGNKHDAALAVDDEEETVEGLNIKKKKRKRFRFCVSLYLWCVRVCVFASYL